MAALTVGWVARPAMGCSVPVFRYALERWNPDFYQIAIFHKGPLKDDVRTALEKVGKDASGWGEGPNVDVVAVDTGTTIPQDLSDVWKHIQAGGLAESLPFMVVRFPEMLQMPLDLTSGTLTAANLKALLESPARTEISKRIRGGHSAVWVLLESGDDKKDGAAEALLAKTLKKLQQDLKLPEDSTVDAGVEMTIDEVATGLRVEFSILRVSRDNPEEKYFVENLLDAEPTLRGSADPAVYVVFGRGRLLTVIPHEDLNEDNIGAIAEFLVGPCSCMVKEQNPGLDLLMAANWNDYGGDIIQERPLTDLPGAADFTPTTGAVSNAAPAGAGEIDKAVPPPSADRVRKLETRKKQLAASGSSKPQIPVRSENRLFLTLMTLATFAVVIVVLGTVLLGKRRKF